MKTKLTTIFKKSANTPPMWVCLLFALVISTNCWADPIAIGGTGTATLNYQNTSNPAGPAANTYQLQNLSHNADHGASGTEYYIVFGTDPFGSYAKTYNSVEWSVTIEPGTYEIAMTYASATWRVQPSFDIYDGSTLVHHIYSPSSSQPEISDWKWQTEFSHTEENVILSVEAAKTYTIRVTADGGDNSGFCMGHISFTRTDAPCANPVDASFAKEGSETGSVPSTINSCEGSSISIPDNGTLVYDNKHIFVGWNDGVNTYAPNSVYTMSNENVQFTAVWKELNVTNLAITNPENNTIPLSWKIPGQIDLSTATTSVAAYFTNNQNPAESFSYNPTTEELTVTYSNSQWQSDGIALPFTLSGLTSITFEFKGHRVYPAVLNSNGSTLYWDYDVFTPVDAADWTKVTRTPTRVYSNNGTVNPLPEAMAITFCGNPNTNKTDESFYIRNVFYSLSDREDIKELVLVRKPNEVPANVGDGVELYRGLDTKYTDTETKTAGTTYYYAVFAVYSDNSISSPVYVSHTMEAATEYTVTYAKGAVDVTGDVPTEGDHIEGAHFTVANKGNLARPGHHFAGWNDGTTTYAAGVSYTMPAHNVTFTAVWNPITVPAVTNLAVGEAVDTEVPLSWKIPGICDLSSAVNPLVTPVNDTYGVGELYINQQNYNEADNYITVSGRSVQWSQYGAGFDIPATTGLEWISYEYKGYHDDISIWGGACDGENAYWKYNTLKSLNDGENWMQSGVEIPNIIYWDGTMDGAAITSKTISQIAVYANAGNATYNDVSFSIRNVRYHLTGQEDIDHVIVVRKDGSAPENATDGTVYNVGTKSHFLDNDDTKEFGHTYYYSVYAVHADGTLSEATTTSHTIVETPTCNITFNIGEGAIGDAPDDIAKKPENSVVTLPSIGSAYKPFYAFTGWKKNNAGDLLAAGSTYTVTADDVSAENISFTAQWTEDNTTLRIPADASLYWENKTGGSNDTKDFNKEKCVDLYTTHNVEWLAYITPGYYDISMMYGAPYYGIRGTFSIIDPSGVESDRVFYTQTDETNDANSITKSIDIMNYDLTGLKKGKLYKIKVEHNWGGSYLCIGHINFNPVTPEEIASETVLDANNTVTTGLTEVTDVDFPGDNDQSVNLYNKKMDWVVKIAKGYYNISLLYGAPQYSTRVSVALIDPEGVEPTRWFCPDQADRNGHYHYTSGTAGTQYYSIGLDKRDLYDIDPEKTYIVRVHDEYGGSNELRVKNLTFSPIAPLEIHEEATLNASNVMVAPSIVDSRIDISNQKEAVWYATIDPHKFDITLTYFAEDGGTKVRFAIIPVGGDTIFVHQENKYDASNTTYTIPALDQDLTNISSGVYKIIVKDNYKSNGSKPQIISLTFSRSVTTHTRTGLTVGNYGTICLPYAVAAEDRNGADLFEIDKWDPNGASLTLSQLTVDENMVAGRPYIFQATEATATFRYYAEGDEAEAGSNNGLVGSYEQALIQQNDDNYIIYNNKLYLVNSEAYVGAYRAYIHKQDQVQPAPAYRRRVTLSVNGAQVATDIDLINDPAQMTKYIENGQLFIFRDGKLYNAQGQLVK